MDQDPELSRLADVPSQGGLLYTASEDGTAQQWRISDGAAVLTFAGHTDWVTACIILNGELFTASADGTIREWSTADGRKAAPQPRPEPQPEPEPMPLQV